MRPYSTTKRMIAATSPTRMPVVKLTPTMTRKMRTTIRYSQSARRRAVRHQPLEGHRRADPDEQAAEERRRNEVEDKFAEKEDAAGDGGHDHADQPVGGAEARGEKAERHRRIARHAAACSCREILEAYRTKLLVEVDVAAGVELDSRGVHEQRHDRDDDDAREHQRPTQGSHPNPPRRGPPAGSAAKGRNRHASARPSPPRAEPPEGWRRRRRRDCRRPGQRTA